tara:strand:- start:1009 stop:1362 length:354 start_codon:yes stop_codon:yes gene_type:complete
VIRFFAISIKIISFTLANAILISAPFLSLVRENLFQFFSTLLNNGLLGLYVVIMLLNFFIPSLRFWYSAIHNKGKFVESFKNILETTTFEKKLDKLIYTYLPIVIVAFYLIKIYILQ